MVLVVVLSRVIAVGSSEWCSVIPLITIIIIIDRDHRNQHLITHSLNHITIDLPVSLSLFSTGLTVCFDRIAMNYSLSLLNHWYVKGHRHVWCWSTAQVGMSAIAKRELLLLIAGSTCTDWTEWGTMMLGNCDLLQSEFEV